MVLFFHAGKDHNTLASVLIYIANPETRKICIYIYIYAFATTALAHPWLGLEMIPNPPVWPSPPVWHLSRRTCQALRFTIARPQRSSHDWDCSGTAGLWRYGSYNCWIYRWLGFISEFRMRQNMGITCDHLLPFIGEKITSICRRISRAFHI